MYTTEKTAVILLVGPDSRLLEQNILHYRSLGLKKILISVHVYGDNGEKHLSKVTAIAEKLHANVADIHTAQGIESGNRYRRLIDNHCGKRDWVVYADLDEFIQFPAPIPDIIDFCEAEGYDYIQGFFLDRIGAKGDFPVLSGQSIWDQFPIGVHLTQTICKGNSNKITLARAQIGVVNGHHFALDGVCCPHELCASIVHHFKWDHAVIERCKEMKALNESDGLPWGHEYQRFIDYVDEGNGLVDVTTPGLQPYWPSYKRTRIPDYEHPTEPWNIFSDPNFLFPEPIKGVQQHQGDGSLVRIRNTLDESCVDADPITSFVFDLADGQKNIYTISNQLAATYPQTWWQIEADVQAVFRNLSHKGLIELRKISRSKVSPLSATFTNADSKPFVVYIIWSYPQVSETYIEKEIAALLDRYHVFVIARYPADALNLRHVPYKITSSPGEMLGIIRNLCPEVLHTHWLDNIQLVADLAEKTLTPFTIRGHSFDIERINRHNKQMFQPELASIWRDLLNHELCLGILTFPYSRAYFDAIGVLQHKVVPCYPAVDYPLFLNKAVNGNGIMNTGACHPKKSMEGFIDLALMLPEKTFNLYPVGYHTPVIVHYNESKGCPVKIHDFTQPDDMPERYKKNNWLVYTADMALKTVGWPLAVAEAQAAGLGVCIPDLRPEMKDYLGGAGFTYSRIEEAAEIISQPYPETMREAGFIQARKSDIREHRKLLEALWAKA